MKELFIAAHEELLAEHMADWDEAHPDATREEYQAEESRAYDALADKADDRAKNKFADMIDHARMLHKEGRI